MESAGVNYTVVLNRTVEGHTYGSFVCVVAIPDDVCAIGFIYNITSLKDIIGSDAIEGLLSSDSVRIVLVSS